MICRGSAEESVGFKVSKTAAILVVKCSEMSLMRDSAVVAFIFISSTVYTINVLSVHDNIGLNLFTLKIYI